MKKFLAFLAVAAPLSTILGVSIFGGKSIPEAANDTRNFIVSILTGTKTTDPTNPPNITDLPNVTNPPIVIIMAPTSEPSSSSSPDNPTAIPEQGNTEGQPSDPPAIKPTTIPGNGIGNKHKTIDFTTFSTTPTPKPDKKRGKKEKSNSKDENSDSKNNTNTSATEPPVLANNESDQTVNKELEITSPGYLMFKSKSSTKKQAKKEESTIGVSKVTDENGNAVENPGSSLFNYSEIVNEDNPEQENDMIYIPITIGIYIFSFSNVDIDGLDVFFTEYTSTDESTEQKNEPPENENLVVPSQGIWQFNVTQNQPEMSCNFKAEKSFTPLIQFYSDEVDDVEIYIKILDAYGKELQNLKLNQKNDNDTYEILGDFSFTENEEYQLQVCSDIQIENVKCSISFTETTNEE